MCCGNLGARKEVHSLHLLEMLAVIISLLALLIAAIHLGLSLEKRRRD